MNKEQNRGGQAPRKATHIPMVSRGDEERNTLRCDEKMGAGQDRLNELIFDCDMDRKIEFVHGEGWEARQLVAEKLIATALIRRSYGFPATDLRLEDGLGVCEGTWMSIPLSSAIAISIAGHCWERRDTIGACGETIDLRAGEHATLRELVIKTRRHECGGMSQYQKDSEASLDLMEWSTMVVEVLDPDREFIERVGGILARKGHLPAAQFDCLSRDNCRGDEAGDAFGDVADVEDDA